MEALNQHIDNLYNAFSKYTIQGNLRERSCDCCVTDQEIRLLLSKPLRELTEKDIYHFMTSAITTFGDVEDYKHFLPRIFELMIDNDNVIDDFLTFEKLNYSEWETWDENEINAVDDYFLSLWLYTIKNEEASHNEIQGLLEIIEKYIGLDKALNIWNEHASNKSILFIVDFVWNNSSIKSYKKSNMLYNWFSSNAIKQKIQDLYFETKDKILATKISVVYTILDNYEN